MKQTKLDYFMTDEEKAQYFDIHSLDIFRSKKNHLASFILECDNTNALKDSLEDWPKEIKVKVVNRFIKANEGDYKEKIIAKQ